MRARLVLAYAQQRVVLREVVLKDKPTELLAASAKGTVPVMVLPNGHVIDESRDVVTWALEQNDPENWRRPPVEGQTADWLDRNDGAFKHWLDRYKYADRHPQYSAEHYRHCATTELQPLEQLLRQETWLHGNAWGLLDASLFPFVRQFAMVDMEWFRQSELSGIRRWLDGWLGHPLFLSVMAKYPKWEAHQAPVIFPADQ